MMPAAQGFRNLTGIFKDREKISREWGQISVETAGEVLAIFDEHLATSDFLAPAFSVADITFGCALDFAQQVRLELPFDQPNLVRYRARLAERASFQNN